MRSEERLAEIRSRAEKATKGPWLHDIDTDQNDMPFVYTVVDKPGSEPLTVDINIGTVADAEFIANCRQDIPFLLSEVDRLSEALRKLRDCDWVISLPDRMDAVREIAREALHGEGEEKSGG
jgi:hypothetical protein